jgi:hypothetical protein
MLANRPEQGPILQKQGFAHEQFFPLTELESAFPPGAMPFPAPMLHDPPILRV